MPKSQGWQAEIVAAAMQWPKVFRGCKENGRWRLAGASDVVVAEFVQSAERIQRELGFPRGEVSPTDSLLERLKARGSNLRSSSPVKERKWGPNTITSRGERVTIHPLRGALVAYLNQTGSKPAVKSRIATGQVAAVNFNRQSNARKSIVRELENMGPEFAGRWPDFVRAFRGQWIEETRVQHPEYRQPVSPSDFRPPFFDRLNQSPAEWKARADLAWKEHRDRFLAGTQFWADEGVDEEIPPAKQIREPKSRRGNRGNNSAVALRHGWAARLLLRFRIKEIAAEAQADPTTVGRIARQILRQANWPWREKNPT